MSVFKIEKEEAKLFEELFRYVESRKAELSERKQDGFGAAKDTAAPGRKPVEELSRQVVGNYEVAVVRENEAGALNRWLEKEARKWFSVSRWTARSVNRGIDPAGIS